MKILILGVPRSGTTTLSHAITQILSYEEFNEPFHLTNKCVNTRQIYQDNKLILPENCVLKTLLNQVPQHLNHSTFDDFYADFFQYFDRIIILSRRNKKELMESYVHAEKTNNWSKKWVENGFIDINESKYFFDKICDYVIRLTDKHNLPITWYEDLYSGNEHKINEILKEWDISGLTYDNMIKFITPENRYRQINNLKRPLI